MFCSKRQLLEGLKSQNYEAALVLVVFLIVKVSATVEEIYNL